MFKKRHINVLLVGTFLVATVLSLTSIVFADILGRALRPNQSNVLAKKNECNTLQDGTILYSTTHDKAGEPIPVGYDEYGYNYQAHMFKGSYANVYLGGAGYPPYQGDDAGYIAEHPAAASHWAWPYRDVELIMQWNDAWISNKDCGVDGDANSSPDGKLDRHYGYNSYVGSGAWETNHMSGEENGEKWTYFAKIVAVPDDAVLTGGYWQAINGKEIGPEIWGQFATIQEVESGLGTTYLSPAGPGFGKW